VTKRLIGIALLLLASVTIAADKYENTLAKDFIMDAPWRVIDAQTPIPLTVILKDCDVDDIRDLHWIRAWDVTADGGAGHRAYTNPIWLNLDTSVAVGEAPAPAFNLAVYPNPGNPHAEIRFTLDTAAPVDVTICSTAGRRVRSLATNLPYGPGTHTLVWDGRDDAGRPASSGAYLVTITSQGRAVSRKLALVR